MTVRDSKVTLGQLRFKKPIISTVNEPIPTKELLSRLQILTDELSAVHQDQVDIETFASIKKDLANKKLLKHANVGVQAYVCCGISDILRIYAPDAPFTANELADIQGILSTIQEASRYRESIFSTAELLVEEIG